MLAPVWKTSTRFVFAAALAALALCPAAGPAQAPNFSVNPYGDCCVSQVSMATFNTWKATCGSCATNPGTFTISQPDPAKPAYVGPGGVTGSSPREAAQAICQCPSQDAGRTREKQLRRFDGQ